MKLELGKIFIHDVQFADRTYVEKGTLYVCRQEIIDLVLADDRLVSAEVELARPGESIRIAPVKDVIEPRVKVDSRKESLIWQERQQSIRRFPRPTTCASSSMPRMESMPMSMRRQEGLQGLK